MPVYLALLYTVQLLVILYIMVVELTAAKIIELAFGGVIQGAVGKVTEMAVEKLRDAIRSKFKDSTPATAAITSVEEGSTSDLSEAANYLNAFMTLEPEFKKEIIRLAQEIKQDKQENKATMHQENHDNSTGFLINDARGVQHIGNVNKQGG